MLYYKNADSYINMEFGEKEGQILVDGIAGKAEGYRLIEIR